MSLVIQNQFLKEQLDNITEIYTYHVVPKLSKRNKAIAIGTAITLSLIALFNEKVLKPPKKLRHIPHISIFNMLIVFIRGESYWERAHRAQIPLLSQPDSKGFYLEYGRAGWELFVNKPEDVKQVLFKTDIFPKFPAPEENAIKTLFGRFLGTQNIAMLSGSRWKAQRKIANPAFHRSMPVQLFGRLTQEMFKVMETMDDTVNVSDLMERWTLDAIGKAGFGFDFHAISDKNSDWVKTYNTVSSGIFDPFFFIFPKFDSDYLWMFPKRVAIFKELDRFLGMLDNIIESKREMIKDENYQNDSLNENEKDLLTLLIESESRGEGVMSNKELRNNLSLFFLAGHDTTSSALSFAIHYLARYPEIQQKAREEAISILGDEPCDVLPTVEETRQMKYINQIMKETLRMNGPVPFLFPRFTSQDTELSGTFIPKDTPVNVGIFNIHHNERYWTNSGEFNPDRFIEGGEGDGDLVEGRTWLPFSTGSRQCIGMSFSLNEQRVMLSMLLRKFTWYTPENSKHKNGVVTSGHFVVSPDQLDITFKRRY